MMNTTSRASRKCFALARQRIVYHDHNNSRSRCFSSILNNSQIFPSIKHDDEQHNINYCRANYQIAIQPTIYSNNDNIIRRQYHITSHNERSGVAVVMGLGALAATAKAGQYAVEGYKEWQAAREAEEKELEELRKANPDAFKEEEEENVNKSQDGSSNNESSQSSTKSKEDDGKRENIFSKFFDMSIGSKYYEGGFEDKMTRKEAALILGVRESSAAKRIKEAHRKLLILNHPDTGGSTFIAGKINEAKELLLKGKK